MSPSARPAQALTPDPTRVVEVAAAVISDVRGRVLLARRTEGRDLAGLWEFPGGKREPDESVEAALRRELREELGITVDVGAPLITVPQAYPAKRLRLQVHHVSDWDGTPRGLEGQALAWVPPDKLHRYAMPPADRPVVAALQQSDRYLVTPVPAPGEAATADAAWLHGLDAAVAAGVRRVQLRLPGLAPERRRALAMAAVRRLARTGVEVLVNGDEALARELGVGLHLRAAQLAGLGSRPVPADVTLAASCHDDAELALAAALGCDFVVLGPVQATPSHPEAAGMGWMRFAALREEVSLPIYAIGGLGPADIPEARRHGAQGVAAIRALWPSA